MKKQRIEQQGFVSIIVAMILIALISLIAVGFAYLVRQNQRAGLNRQLSTQAFYAAESGVNDAVQQLRQNGPYQEDDCRDTGSTLTTGVEYTCVLVNSRPDTLVFDSISASESTITHITAGEPITSLQVAWQDTDSANTRFSALAGLMAFPQTTTMPGCPPGSAGCASSTATFPNYIGALRTTIIPTSAAHGANPVDNLLNQSQTVFMYPRGTTGGANTGGTIGSRATGSAVGNESLEGQIVSGRCNAANTPRKCIVTIQNIGSADFYVRLKAIYKDVAVTITAKNATGGTIPISGAQALVDSTGKAQDVLRRIQVRVPLSDAYYFPEFALESMDTTCKRLTVWPGGAQYIPGVNGLYTAMNGHDALNNRDADNEACRID